MFGARPSVARDDGLDDFVVLRPPVRVERYPCVVGKVAKGAAHELREADAPLLAQDGALFPAAVAGCVLRAVRFGRVEVAVFRTGAYHVSFVVYATEEHLTDGVYERTQM